MICEFCAAENVDGHRVATRLGRAAILCKQCQTGHGVYASRKANRPSKAQKGRESRDAPDQLPFSFCFHKEPGSPAEATRS